MKPSGKSRINDVRVGVHTSIGGGISKAVDRAASLNCRTLQMVFGILMEYGRTNIPRS